MNNNTHKILVEDIEVIIQKMIKDFNQFVSNLERNLPDKKQVKTGNLLTYSAGLLGLMEKLHKHNKRLFVNFECQVHGLWKQEMENVD